VVLIMTTNAGASEMSRPAVGFEREARVGEDEEAIKRMFAPEFRNRLDSVIGFGALPTEVVALVVDKFIRQLEDQLSERNVAIKLAPAAREWLVKKGYDPLYGARPLARVIQEHIKKPMADELLFGRLAKGGTVIVDVADDALSFVYGEVAPKKPKPPIDGDDAPDGDKPSGGGKKEPALVE